MENKDIINPPVTGGEPSDDAVNKAEPDMASYYASAASAASTGYEFSRDETGKGDDSGESSAPAAPGEDAPAENADKTKGTRPPTPPIFSTTAAPTGR